MNTRVHEAVATATAPSAWPHRNAGQVHTAVLTIAMLLAGGVVTMEYATLIFALPVTVIAYLVMASFYKALRIERAEREGPLRTCPSAHAQSIRSPAAKSQA